jgi:hypothetical protein
MRNDLQGTHFDQGMRNDLQGTHFDQGMRNDLQGFSPLLARTSSHYVCVFPAEN